MEKKKLNYILIFVLVVVWGLVVYRLFFKGKGTVVSTSPTMTVVEDVEVLSIDTFQLLSTYRDPFLGSIKKPVVYSAPRPKVQKIVPVVPKEKPKPIDWSFIHYKGSINSKDRKTGLVNFRGQSMIVHEGDSLGDVYIKNILPNQITIIFKDSTKTLIPSI